MFTTAAPLAQRIERLIEQTPIVDPHTHLRPDQPSAPDLASLMSYHWLQSELISVGMPKSDLDTALPPDERVRRALPYLPRMRNTAMSWCFHVILRDLFDLADPLLCESNASEIISRVAAACSNPQWPAHVLRERCHIQAVVTSSGNAATAPRDLGVDVYHMLDAHYLFCPGVATDLTPHFAGRTQKTEYVDALKSILGDLPANASLLRTALFDWLEKTVRGRVRFSNTFIPIEQRFHPPESSAVDRVLATAGRGKTLSDEDINTLVIFVSWHVLAWHHEHGKAFQIAVGAEYFICDGKSIPRFDPTWTSQMAPVFHTFSNARFDLMMAAEPLMQEMCVLARQFPNIYLSGYWWHSFFPALIEKAITLRLQIAPMTKLTAFLCDAYYCEWTYGKYRLVKKCLASALAGLVESRFIDEDLLPDLLHQILNDSPRSLYDLHDA